MIDQDEVILTGIGEHFEQYGYRCSVEVPGNRAEQKATGVKFPDLIFLHVSRDYSDGSVADFVSGARLGGPKKTVSITVDGDYLEVWTPHNNTAKILLADPNFLVLLTKAVETTFIRRKNYD